VALTWTAPASVNIGAVTDYIIQYRRAGSSTWITFRDGTSTARRATVTGLSKGRAYYFRIAAKNKAGTGTWSVEVLRTAN
jgi:Fibronectin type III domain